jgi:hypothetical protein
MAVRSLCVAAECAAPAATKPRATKKELHLHFQEMLPGHAGAEPASARRLLNRRLQGMPEGVILTITPELCSWAIIFGAHEGVGMMCANRPSPE